MAVRAEEFRPAPADAPHFEVIGPLRASVELDVEEVERNSGLAGGDLVVFPRERALSIATNAEPRTQIPSVLTEEVHLREPFFFKRHRR